jgi:hypothetical protein
MGCMKPDQDVRRHGVVDLAVAGHDHGVGAPKRLKTGRDGDGEAAVGTDLDATGVQMVSRYFGSLPNTCAAIPSSSGNTSGSTSTTTWCAGRVMARS